jgi:hypothetical protein
VRYEDVVLADGPVAYWPLSDTSGTAGTALVGSNATWAGSPAVGAHPFPAGGRVVELDLSNDCAQVASFNLTAYSSIVVELWWRPRSYASLQMLAETSADFGSTNGTLGFYMDTAGVINVGTSNGGGVHRIGTLTYPATLGRWHHFACQINRAAAPSSWFLMIDGRPNTLGNAVNGAVTGNFATLTLNIGARNNGASFPAGGAFGHLAIYPTLAASRVALHYRMGTRQFRRGAV